MLEALARSPRMRLAVALLLAAATAVPAAATGVGWTDCSMGHSLFHVVDVSLAPNPVHPGDTANFSISADSSKDVSSGTVQMVVHYAGMPIWTQLDNLCDKAACPIKPGPTEVRYSQLFPSITPPGYYSVKLDGSSGTEPLFCVVVNFQVVVPGEKAMSADQVAKAWGQALGGSSAEA